MVCLKKAMIIVTCFGLPQQVLREPIRDYFPDANGALTKAAACMFTMTPDGHFIVDLHPAHPEVCPFPLLFHWRLQ